MRNREEGCIKMEIEKIRNRFMEVFDKNEDDYEKCRKKVVSDIENFISEQKDVYRKNKQELMVVNSPLSRVKNKDHFWGKLLRNGDIDRLNIDETWTDESFDQIIREKLTDLIGLRIVCYFKTDEEKLYRALKDFLTKEPYFNFIDDPVDKTIPATEPYPIYFFKTQGKVKISNKIYSIEIQLKSMSNDLWGEVDHEMVYKAQQYQYNSTFTNDISTNIHKVLLASDQQLNSLLNQRYKREEIINTLFFVESEKVVFNGEYTDIANKIYNSFFEIYSIEECRKQINSFVGRSLLNENNNKIIWNENTTPVVVFFCNEFINRLFAKKILQIKKIADVLFFYKDQDLYFNHISFLLLNKFMKQSVEEDSYSFTPVKKQFDLIKYQKKIESLKCKKDQKVQYSAFLTTAVQTNDFSKLDPDQQEWVCEAYLNLINTIR